ncbi:MAG TPA: hypothetical protein VJ915_12105 [Balneolaceae bacterium]|nr:hypothetical protein [Balneolaceae bacterium]
MLLFKLGVGFEISISRLFLFRRNPFGAGRWVGGANPSALTYSVQTGGNTKPSLSLASTG